MSRNKALVLLSLIALAGLAWPISVPAVQPGAEGSDWTRTARIGTPYDYGE